MAKEKSPFGRLFGGIWRLLIVIYTVLLLIVVLAVPVGIYLFVFGGAPVSVPENSALVWAPTGDLVAERDPVATVVAPLIPQPRQVTVVRDLIKMLDRAATDERIDMVFMKLGKLGAAQAGELQDLARAIQRFKRSGKPIIAWSPSYNQAQYYLASLADTVYMGPLGHVYLSGYGVFRNYFAEALNKLDISINVFRVGKYKSAVEPLIRNSMSPAARQANMAWLTSLWSSYKSNVRKARELPAGAIEGYIADYADRLAALNGDAAQLARQAGLVDKVVPFAVVKTALRKEVGSNLDTGEFRHIGGQAYLEATEGGLDMQQPDDHIALVVVEGPIVTGESVAGVAGADTIARLIAHARRDDDVVAMVLRINSPGGSVVASERIRRQVERMREVGKPVVVSMSGVAASGGYWIAMNANQIWAEPTTLTGSIGVFGMIPTIGKALENLGISSDGVGTTHLSGAFQIDSPLAQPAETIVSASVKHAYQVFISKVAHARNMTVEAVDAIAKGRVWSGADAARLGLVDHLGGFRDAVQAAAELAGLEAGEYALVRQRPPLGWREALLRFLSGRLTYAVMPDWLNTLVAGRAPGWMQLYFGDPRGMYARCFCRVTPAISGF